MVLNLLWLVIIVAITGLLGWLTVRAVKNKRIWVKILGGLAVGLLALIFLIFSTAGIKGFFGIYFAGLQPAPDIQVESTPKMVSRGEYIVHLGCIGCHGANGSGSLPLTGGVDMAATDGFGFIGKTVTSNLTPGGNLAHYADGEIFRAIRMSVSNDGQKLGFMGFLSYNQLSDDDIMAVIAYLRSLPADPGTGPGGDDLNILGVALLGANIFPSAPPVEGVVAALPPGVTPEYGKYVALLGDCSGCHGADMTGTPAGGFGPPPSPNPRPFVKTLTVDEFIETMRTGVRPNGIPFADSMPWETASRMTDQDLAALYAYLSAEP